MQEKYFRFGDCRGTLKEKNNKRVPSSILDNLHFNVYRELENVDAPIYICHSKKDKKIPITSSKSLENRIRNLDGLFILGDCSHSFRPLDEAISGYYRDKVYHETLAFFKKHMG